jgi:hypothetical protein
MENTLKKTIDRYMLRNEISNYKNDEVEKTLRTTMFGGNGSESCLQNSAIFNHTLQMLNNNQTTMVNGLRGGRVSMPRTYFDPKAKDNMVKGGRVSMPRTYFDPKAKDNMVKGGRISMPSAFFNPSGRCNMVEFPKYTVTGDVSTSVIRQGIPATIGGGKKKNALSFQKFKEMTGGHFSNKQNRELFANYNQNLEKFTSVLKHNGGKNGVITVPKINYALKLLKKEI